MANFNEAFKITLQNEGGYGNDVDDPGGETYKGIARKINSKWSGWSRIDVLKRQSGFPNNLENDIELQENVKVFYQINYWDKIKGDNILDQDIANDIYDFGVNAGIQTSSILAQTVAYSILTPSNTNADIDGVIGNDSIAALNAIDKRFFIAAFTVAKIARYVHIIKKRPTSRKYFYGWVLRALGETN